MSNVSGISAYQQTNQVWNAQSASKSESKVNTTENAETKKVDSPKEWKNVSSSSSLVPLKNDDYGYVIGDVKLSDKAKEYYNKLKEKFHGMDFICVSKDMKDQVASNALSYGNSAKPVVLIDEEKLERMATDEAYRKKYEGIIESSQSKLLEMKNGLASSGASVKNFGMSVGDDGKTTFFATLVKNNKEVMEIQQERLAKKKAEKAAAEKKAEKKEAEEKIEENREEKAEAAKEAAENAEEAQLAETLAEQTADPADLDYYMAEDVAQYAYFEADSYEALLSNIQTYAFENSSNVKTAQELAVGQNIDFKG